MRCENSVRTLLALAAVALAARLDSIALWLAEPRDGDLYDPRRSAIIDRVVARRGRQ